MALHYRIVILSVCIVRQLSVRNWLGQPSARVTLTGSTGEWVEWNAPGVTIAVLEGEGPRWEEYGVVYTLFRYYTIIVEYVRSTSCVYADNPRFPPHGVVSHICLFCTTTKNIMISKIGQKLLSRPSSNHLEFLDSLRGKLIV